MPDDKQRRREGVEACRCGLQQMEEDTLVKLLWRFVSRLHSEDQRNNNTYSDETKRMVNLLML